jgi:tetratricopeptide (TPR) repeat protein
MKRRYNPALWALATIITLSTVYCGCSSNKGSSPTYDVNAKLSEAWASFGAGNFDAALTTFSDVLSHSANNAEALTGRGWCHAFKREYSTAIADFNSSIQQSSNADAKMGLSAVYRDLPDLQAAITNASAVIAADSHYVFAKKTSIDFKDAHLIKAQCFFRQGKDTFPSAHIEVNYLCVLLGLAGLPDSSTLSAAEYERQLGQRLVDLSARIGD